MHQSEGFLGSFEEKRGYKAGLWLLQELFYELLKNSRTSQSLLLDEQDLEKMTVSELQQLLLQILHQGA